jgi:hypothetical protein
MSEVTARTRDGAAPVGTATELTMVELLGNREKAPAGGPAGADTVR